MIARARAGAIAALTGLAFALVAGGSDARDAGTVGVLEVPAGWRAVSLPIPGVVPGSEFATMPVDGFGPNLNVVVTHVPLSAEIAATHDLTKQNWTIDEDAAFPCASGYRARLFAYTHPYGRWTLDGVVVLMARIGASRTNVVTYSRPHGTPRDPAAMFALAKYCGTAR